MNSKDELPGTCRPTDNGADHVWVSARPGHMDERAKMAVRLLRLRLPQQQSPKYQSANVSWQEANLVVSSHRPAYANPGRLRWEGQAPRVERNGRMEHGRVCCPMRVPQPQRSASTKTRHRSSPSNFLPRRQCIAELFSSPANRLCFHVTRFWAASGHSGPDCAALFCLHVVIDQNVC